MNLKQKLAAAVKAANDILATAKAEGRDLTEAELTEVEAKTAEARDLRTQIERFEKGAALRSELDTLGATEDGDTPAVKDSGDTPARSLGEHFVKHVKRAELSLKNPGTIAAPAFLKANTDTVVTGGSEGDLAGMLTQIDTTVVSGYRRPTVTDLLGSSTIAGQAITYYVEGDRAGDFGMVAEAGQKPQIHYENPTPVTDRLKEIAGFIRISDDMVDDLPFLVNEINVRLLYDLSLKEEDQLLNGDGTGNNILGLLQRSGIQTETSAALGDNADALFRAITKVQNVAGMNPDGIIMNPADYQALRLERDGNGQYYGGGFFAGQYGQGGIAWQLPVWGLNTVVSPAVAKGTAIVGALNAASTVYRRNGVQVESTNSHADDFTNDRITIRAKERLALAVRRPSAIVKVTLSDLAE